MNGCMNVEESSRVVILCTIPNICLEHEEVQSRFSVLHPRFELGTTRGRFRRDTAYGLARYCCFITSATTFRLSVTHIASVDW